MRFFLFFFSYILSSKLYKIHNGFENAVREEICSSDEEKKTSPQKVDQMACAIVGGEKLTFAACNPSSQSINDNSVISRVKLVVVGFHTAFTLT